MNQHVYCVIKKITSLHVTEYEKAVWGESRAFIYSVHLSYNDAANAVEDLYYQLRELKMTTYGNYNNSTCCGELGNDKAKCELYIVCQSVCIDKQL